MINALTVVIFHRKIEGVSPIELPILLITYIYLRIDTFLNLSRYYSNCLFIQRDLLFCLVF